MQLFLNCQQDISDIEEIYITKSEEGTEFLNIKTVTKTEAIGFLKSGTDSKSSQYYLNPNFEKARHEKIDHESDSLYKIPVETVRSSTVNDIYLLKVNNSVKSVILHYYPLSKLNKASFTGTLIVTDLSGNLIKGYKMEKGNLLASYTLKSAKKTIKKGYEKSGECDESLNTNSDFCEQDLDEVIITTSTEPSVTYIAYTSIVPSNDEESYDGGGMASGGVGTNIAQDFNENNIILGPKPIKEFPDKCSGIQDAWNNFPENEVSGYITVDGKILITSILPYSGGPAAGTYTHSGTTYYPYSDSEGAPAQSYYGVLHQGGYYFIPVVASFHTHAPCRSDGTDGTSHPVSSDDKTFAQASPSIRHWAIGCGSVAQYDGNSASFFNKNSGDLSNICSTPK